MMKPVFTPGLLNDFSVDYSDAVKAVFEPVKVHYDRIESTVRHLLDHKMMGGPLSLLEVQAVLDANFIVTRYVDILKTNDIIKPAEHTVDVTLNSCLSAIVAMKIRDQQIYEATNREGVERCLQLIEYIVNDETVSKKETLAALTLLKNEVTRNIKAIRTRHVKPFPFPSTTAKYASRKNDKENPEEFFERVYAPYLHRGLQPAQIKYHDEAYYNVLHVWCSRHKKSMKTLFEIIKEDRITDKQRLIEKMRNMPTPED